MADALRLRLSRLLIAAHRGLGRLEGACRRGSRDDLGGHVRRRGVHRSHLTGHLHLLQWHRGLSVDHRHLLLALQSGGLSCHHWLLLLGHLLLRLFVPLRRGHIHAALRVDLLLLWLR